MYRGRLWTMRQYAGFGTAEATNERFKFLLGAGQTGLSCAFDLPTQMGYDSDHPRAEGEVGKVGVAISSIDDMRLLARRAPARRGHDVDDDQRDRRDAAAALRARGARSRASPGAALRGTIQNDILKEYIARGTYIYPPRPSMRLVTDTFAYCREHLPSWNTISISGYHIREAGSTAVQEVAFTLADGIAYVQAALDAGLAVDEFAPRLSFFFNAHNNLFEEVAKFRAARRLWARIMTRALRREATRGRRCCGSTPRPAARRSPPSSRRTTSSASRSRRSPRCSAAPSASTPTASTRRSALPTERRGEARAAHPADHRLRVGRRRHGRSARRLVLRRGAHRRDRAPRDATYLEEIDRRGGAVAAIEAGYLQGEIEAAAYADARAVDDGAPRRRRRQPLRRRRRRAAPDVFPVDVGQQAAQAERVARLKVASATGDGVAAALADLEAAARGTQNLLVPMRVALSRRATLGEVADVLRGDVRRLPPRRLTRRDRRAEARAQRRRRSPRRSPSARARSRRRRPRGRPTASRTPRRTTAGG